MQWFKDIKTKAMTKASTGIQNIYHDLLKLSDRTEKTLNMHLIKGDMPKANKHKKKRLTSYAIT